MSVAALARFKPSSTSMGVRFLSHIFQNGSNLFAP